MESRTLLMFLAIMLGITSSSSYFWLWEVRNIEIFLICFLCPCLGLLEVFRFYQRKQMNLGFISASPEQQEKQITIVIISYMLIALPLLFNLSS